MLLGIPLLGQETPAQADSAQMSQSLRDSLIGGSAADTLSLQVQDTLQRDTLKRKGLSYLLFPGPRPPYDPKVAWRRSIIFPGWGQIYNRRYWKLPLVYGAYGGMIYAIDFNNKQYQRFRQAFQDRNDDDESNDFDIVEERFSTSAIKNARESARRNRDFTIILTVGVHVLQTVEAFVDAHLRGFDISPDLSLKVYPGVIEHPFYLMPGQRVPGMTLSIPLATRAAPAQEPAR